MIDEVYHIIIFHCIWHSCLLHGKDGICRGDSQILVSSRAVTKKRPWDVSVGPAGYPVLHVSRVAVPRKKLGITIQRLIGVNMEPLLLGTELDAE